MLPRRLQYLDLSHNQITGTIRLTNLPPAFVTLEIADNRISQEVLYYGNLPKSVLYLCVYGRMGENKIGQIMPLSKHDVVDEKRMFHPA